MVFLSHLKIVNIELEIAHKSESNDLLTYLCIVLQPQFI